MQKVISEEERKEKNKAKKKARLNTLIEKYKKEILQHEKKLQLLRRKSNSCAEELTKMDFPSLFE